MIDINCHILPGMDNGSKSMTESLVMARAAEKEGIKRIIATPNIQAENNSYTLDGIPAAVDQLNDKLAEEGIDVYILPGQENRIYPNMADDLQAGKILTLNESKYVSIELPAEQIPSYTTQLLFDIQIAGMIPILVSPEKNDELIASPDKLYRMVKNGALTQLSAASLVGKSGKKVERFAHQLLEANLAHFFASNATYVKKQSFYMKEALHQLKKKYGNAFARQLIDNSAAVVANENIYKDAPERISTKKRWVLF